MDAAPDGVDAGQVGPRERFLQTFPTGGFVDLGPRIRRVWGTTFSRGRSPSESVTRFYREWSGLWDVKASDLVAVGPFEDGAHTVPLVGIEGTDGASEFTGVYFTQTVMGVPVFRAYGWGLVRNERDFPMVLGGGTLRPVGDLADRMAGRDLNPANLDAGLYAGAALAEFDEPPVTTSPRYVIWAGIDDDIQKARLAVEFVAEAGAGQGDPDAYRKVQFVTDADTGEVLHRESLVRHVVTGTVTGLATDGFGADTCANESSKPMPHIEVKTGTTTVYADASGNYSIPAGASGATYTTRLVGRYFTTTNNSAATVSLSTTANDGATWNPVFNAANTSATERAQVNAYYMANLMRDLCVSVSPSFPSVSTQTNAFQVNCNLASTCNAYYVSSTINFYVSGGGCANTAFGDVVAHEYGHNIVEKGGSGQQAYGEGMGDICGLLLSDDPRTGVGFQTCSTGIRTASNTCQYSATSCSSCGSAIHTCGQLISGCVWDLRNLFLAKYPSNGFTRHQCRSPARRPERHRPGHHGRLPDPERHRWQHQQWHAGLHRDRPGVRCPRSACADPVPPEHLVPLGHTLHRQPLRHDPGDGAGGSAGGNPQRHGDPEREGRSGHHLHGVSHDGDRRQPVPGQPARLHLHQPALLVRGGHHHEQRGGAEPEQCADHPAHLHLRHLGRHGVHR
ncbi:MAG: hypothetical protein EBQ99_01315 [Planctomycetes bacterium]|nr:hypothetical protein [Planctomycetota bacterium]